MMSRFIILLLLILSGSLLDTSGSKLRFRGLQSNSFAHPVDIALRRQLSSVPFIEGLTRGLISNVERGMVIENLSRGLLVGSKQLPELHALLTSSCSILDIKDVPELYVIQSSEVNAYTLAINGRKPFIVVYSRLLELLTPEELQVVLAHELGHLKCEHGLWITALNVLAFGIRQTIFGMLLSPTLEGLLLQWLRAAEYTCDRAAILVAQDWRLAANTILKINVGNAGKIYGSSPNVDAFLEQGERLREETKSSSGTYISGRLEQQSTHPLPVVRVRMMKEWSESAQYKGIIARGTRDS